ncbi:MULTISPECIES: hypothetical protein [unclassified Microcoleus]|nr:MULTISPECIES: hypothetical protein [unclassified Microcoleus]
MNSLILISPDRGYGFQPILSGNSCVTRASLRFAAAPTSDECG